MSVVCSIVSCFANVSIIGSFVRAHLATLSFHFNFEMFEIHVFQLVLARLKLPHVDFRTRHALERLSDERSSKLDASKPVVEPFADFPATFPGDFFQHSLICVSIVCSGLTIQRL